MNELREPLVSESENLTIGAAASSQASFNVGSDSTMLTTRASNKISSQGTGGLNRRQEIELKHYEKPVLDIERINQRRRMNANQGQEMS